MKKEKKTLKKQGFTLVELIIVIAIIAVLAVAAFMMLTKWLGQSRDSRRLADLETIKKSLTVNYSDPDTSELYPMPDNSAGITDGAGGTGWYQGSFGNTAVSKMDNLQKAPKDPRGELYKYSVTEDQYTWEVYAELENGEEVSYMNQVSAAEMGYIVKRGNYNGYLIVNSGSTYNLYNVPSLYMYSGSSIISGDKNYVYSNGESNDYTFTITGVDITDIKNGSTDYSKIEEAFGLNSGEGKSVIPQAAGSKIKVNNSTDSVQTISCEEGYENDGNGNCVLVPLYSFTSHTFTNCGKTGITGPTLVQCTSSYDTTWDDNTSYYGMTIQGIQEWTVPKDGAYTISAYGAGSGGAGAKMEGDFNLTAGTKLKILVGQMGGIVASLYAGSGGTFVAMLDDTPLIVAGGGGGAPSNSSTGNANVTTNGKSAAYPGGTDGNGTEGGSGYYGDNTSNGKSFVNGGIGGYRATHSATNLSDWYSVPGGFGAGGEAYRYKYLNARRAGNGGGGGYSGGSYSFTPNVSSTSASGGGAGSYNSGTNQSNSAGANFGHGKVVIEYIGN